MDTMIERVARALTELHIRQARRHNTGIAELEAMMPKAVDLAWRDRIPEARIAIRAMRDFPDQLGCSLPRDYKPGSHSMRELWDAIVYGALAEQL